MSSPSVQQHRYRNMAEVHEVFDTFPTQFTCYVSSEMKLNHNREKTSRKNHSEVHSSECDQLKSLLEFFSHKIERNRAENNLIVSKSNIFLPTNILLYNCLLLLGHLDYAIKWVNPNIKICEEEKGEVISNIPYSSIKSDKFQRTSAQSCKTSVL